MLETVEISLPKEAPFLETGYLDEEIRAMQRAIISLFDRWKVSDQDAGIILGGISAKTFSRWRREDYGRVGRDLADRMSNLLGIHKALRIIFAEPQRSYEWIKADNEAFAGQSAFTIMKRGGMEDIIRIRRYLDSVRGGW